jgi:hypothetical protein
LLLETVICIELSIYFQRFNNGAPEGGIYMKTQRVKQVRRLVMVLCSNCLGTGIVPMKNGDKKCPNCKGKGEVEKWIVELINDDD